MKALMINGGPVKDGCIHTALIHAVPAPRPSLDSRVKAGCLCRGRRQHLAPFYFAKNENNDFCETEDSATETKPTQWSA